MNGFSCTHVFEVPELIEDVCTYYDVHSLPGSKVLAHKEGCGRIISLACFPVGQSDFIDPRAMMEESGRWRLQGGT